MPYNPYAETPAHTLLSLYIRKMVDESGSSENIVLVEMPPEVGTLSEVKYRIACKECKMFVEQVAVDWSVNFDLDSLIKTVIQFSQDHRHIDEPPERVFRLD